MPSVIGKALTDDEIWKILVYVRSLYQGAPKKIDWVPPPKSAAPKPVAAGEGRVGDAIAAGKALFESHCVACHGSLGKAMAQLPRGSTRSQEISATQSARCLRVGVAVMGLAAPGALLICPSNSPLPIVFDWLCHGPHVGKPTEPARRHEFAKNRGAAVSLARKWPERRHKKKNAAPARSQPRVSLKENW
jgi:Cytochrome c